MRAFGTAGLRRLSRSVRRLARTSYPPFLLGGAAPRNEIPVFTYHDVDADVLRGDLEHLSRNGYETLGLDDFHARSARPAGSRDKLVLLTFDDARRNFWEAAYPVLRERGARATLFVPSYWIGEPTPAGEAGETSLGAGGSAPAAAADEFMTWEQLRRCAASGSIDVESHAHSHALVATSGRLAGFATPAALAHYDLFDWPMRREGGADVAGRPAPGTPIYESQPLLSAPHRVLEPPTAAAACRRLVEEEGGAAFFERRDAEEALRSAHAAAVERGGGALPLSEAEFRRQVEDELRRAVGSFERELGRRPSYFAYPWMLGSPPTLEILAGLGFRAAFGVALDFRRARANREPITVYGRYKSDWIRFLPGRGRKRLHHVLPGKVATFLKAQHLAH